MPPKWAADGGNGSVVDDGGMTQISAMVVFEVQHELIKADPTISGHQLWMISHDITRPAE